MSAVSTNHLKSMGYRQLETSQKWAKPVGFNLFVFDLDTQEWACYFRAANNGDALVWDRCPYTVESYVYEDREEDAIYQKPEEWLAHREAYYSAISRGKEEPWSFLDQNLEIGFDRF